MTTKLMTMTAAAALCASAFAADCKCGKPDCKCGDKCECTSAECKCAGCTSEKEEVSEGWAWAMGEGVTFDEKPIVSCEASLAFDSKYLSYGFVDNKDPILTPEGSITLFDWVTFGVNAIFDTTTYGRRAGYTSRQFQYTELHPTVTIGHSFSPEDFEWLPTTIDIAVGYDYEYHPNSKNKGGLNEYENGWDKSIAEDTQFVTLEFGLPDLWFEPTFLYERDIMRDDGTYLNLEIGHTFGLIEADEEGDDDTLTLRPSVAQGFGNAQRVKAYAAKEDGEPLNHAGLMDTLFKLELGWNICDGVALTAYAGYSDFLFDRKIRDASRRYEATGKWDESWNFIAGAAVTFSF